MRKIDTSLETALTKPTKAPFVSSVSSISKESLNISPWLRRAKELAALAAQTVQAAEPEPRPEAEILSLGASEAAAEHFTERAAIAELDGELPREEAETQARSAVFRGRHAYHFTLVDIPNEAPVVICDEPTVEAAQRSLEKRFGEGRIIACWRVGEREVSP